MTDIQKTSDFEKFKQEMKINYDKLTDEEKVVYWTGCVYGLYKGKKLPTSVSDKLFFEKLQEAMDIKATDEISQKVNEQMATSLKNRQRALFNMHRDAVQSNETKVNNDAGDENKSSSFIESVIKRFMFLNKKEKRNR